MMENATGLTQGARFHHLASRQIPVEGVVSDLIVQLDAAIEAATNKDAYPHGRFMEPDIDVTLHDPMMKEVGQWAALHISILARADPAPAGLGPVRGTPASPSQDRRRT